MPSDEVEACLNEPIALKRVNEALRKIIKEVIDTLEADERFLNAVPVLKKELRDALLEE